MTFLKTVAIYTNETNGAAADVTIYTNPSSAIATKALLMRDYAEAGLEKTRGLVSLTLGAGTAEAVVLDVQGRMSDEDTFVTVLAAPLDEDDSGGIFTVENWPQMNFVLTSLDAGGGTGLTVKYSYLSRGTPPSVAVGTLAADRLVTPTL